MTSRPPSSSPGWRPDRVDPGPTVRAGETPAWRHPPVGGPSSSSRVPVGRLAGVFALVLGVATALVWLLLWLRPPGPACLVLVGADYADNLAVAPHPQASGALDRFTRLVGTSSPLSNLFRRSGRLRVARQVASLSRGEDWARGLDEAPEQTAIVFFSLRGGADRQGAFLLPQDATADPEDRLRLTAILDRLAGLPEGRNKLLVLDLATRSADATQGQIDEDFARAVVEIEPRIAAIPRLVVVVSAGVDQSASPSADLRTSLFATHFLAGLAGKADRNGDGLLDAWELMQYVGERTEADAARLWGTTQTTLLLPRDDGERRARETPLTFRLEAVEDDPAADPLPEIAAGWADYRAFTRRAAAQAAVPRDWRLWQAWLVRYEQFRLAGSPAAPALLEQSRQAARRVREGLDLDLTCTSATLAMPAVVGQTRLEVPNPYPPFEALWRAAAGERRAVVDRLRGDSLARRNLLVACVRRAAENPARNLDRAVELARLLDDPLRPARATEAHFLVLLARDRAVREIPETLGDAIRDGLRMRLLAEETALAIGGEGHSYAERLRPAVAGHVARGDERRQLGQDKLFGSDPASWASARKLFDEAKQAYTLAQRDAAILREANAARDRAFDELPGHASWLVEAETDDPTFRLALTLHDRARQLDDLLSATSPEKSAELGALAQETQAGMARLRVRLDAFAQSCDSEASKAGRAVVALRDPDIDAGTRSRLLGKLARLERMGRTQGEVKVVTAQDQETLGKQRAVRQGRLALAALGPALFDQLGGDTADVYADVEPRVRRPDLGPGWSQILRWAGDQIGSRRRAIPRRAEDGVARARKNPDDAGADLRPADRLSRLLDAGQWQKTRDDAPAMVRRQEVQELLAWQATRTHRDHWFGDDDGLTPYYRVIAREFLRDSLAVDAFARKEVASISRLRANLEREDRITLDVPTKRHMIPGDRLVLAAKIRRGAEIGGEPVLWARPDEPVEFADAGSSARVPLASGEAATVRVLSRELDQGEAAPPNEATPRPSQVTWSGYFRGQKPVASTPIDLHPAAESVRVEYARPPKAGVAVRAEESLFAEHGQGQGGVALVFDCSGSVGAVGTEERTRKSVATQTLRRILEKIPRGTRVSLWIFGQAVPPGNTVVKVEETVRRVSEPATWAASTQEIDDLVGRVEAETPWNQSPVTSAILSARADLLTVKGFRHLIVLSDGDDNRIDKDKAANPKAEPIAELLTKRMAGTNIAVHLVGFAGADGKPEPALEKNFGVVTKLSPPGTLTTVDRTGPLSDALSQSMRLQLDYRLTAGSRLRVLPVALRQDPSLLPAPIADEPTWGAEVARPGENDRWVHLPREGDYRLGISRLELDREVRLGAGDYLLLQLGPGRRSCRRAIWSREPSLALRPNREANGWRTAVVQNQLLAGRALQMLVSVEKLPEPNEVPAQVRPEDLWLEVKPASGKTRPVVQWGEVVGHPAPAWGVDSPGWPTEVMPRVKAWWREDSGNADRVLRAEADFRDPLALRGEFVVAGQKVMIEGVSVEQRWVSVTPTKRERRWCLVLRASHDAGKPMWSRIAGFSGQEHRHYLEAGRYVGLFWAGAEDDEATIRSRAGAVGSIRLIGAGAFTKTAGEVGHAADFEDLVTPASTPPRPEPLLVWP